MPGGLLTDLYELNMAASYLRRDMDGLATFSLYVRGLPKARGFLVAAGLESCLDFLESFSFTDDELDGARLDGLRRSGARGLLDPAVRRARSGRCPRGVSCYSEEPMLEVTAPVAVAQVVETVLLNQITLHTTLASKAARYVIAAEGRQLVDFAFRRTHGRRSRDGDRTGERPRGVRRDVERRGGPPLRARGGGHDGALVHRGVPDRGRGVPRVRRGPPQPHDVPRRHLRHARRGARGDRGDPTSSASTARSGVRLDSGDLDALARGARALLDEAGLAQARIFASGGLDELEVHELVRAGAPVDAFGIGTQMGVSADAPYVDSVYKLVEYDGRPVMKLSSAKVSPPGASRCGACADG